MFFLIGYFLFFILFIVLGLIFPKAGWVFYWIGAGVQLIGMFGLGSGAALYWIIYIALLVGGGLAISARRNKS